LVLVMLASSVVEVLSLAAVLPFLAVLANPEGLWNQPLVQQWAPRLGFAGAQELLLPITVNVITLHLGDFLLFSQRVLQRDGAGRR
jgi:hypothetical protein